MKSVLPDFRAELLPLLKKKKEAIFSLYHYRISVACGTHRFFIIFNGSNNCKTYFLNWAWNLSRLEKTFVSTEQKKITNVIQKS